VNFCVVASFFIQYKDLKSIEEALKVIKSWNDTWSPQYFVTNYCEAEFNAWLRWTNKLGNFSVKDFRGEFFTLWRNIAKFRKKLRR